MRVICGTGAHLCGQTIGYIDLCRKWNDCELVCDRCRCTTLKGLHDSAWRARLSTLSYKIHNGWMNTRPYLLYS
jgi:hypothetical protein